MLTQEPQRAALEKLTVRELRKIYRNECFTSRLQGNTKKALIDEILRSRAIHGDTRALKEELRKMRAALAKMRKRVCHCADCEYALECEGGALICCKWEPWDYYNDCPGGTRVPPDGFCHLAKRKDSK